MSVIQDPDVWRSASHRLMATHLTGPFSAGAADRSVDIDASGHALVEASRQPLLLAGTLVPLNVVSWRLEALLDPGGAATPLLPLLFNHYTEAGAFLPLHGPEPDSATQFAPSFDVRLQLIEISSDGIETAIPAAQLAARIELRLVEGIMGRVIYLLGAEKQRLRRQAREISAMRRLERARDNALDRMGAEVGVPRFEDHITYKNGEISTEIRREPDVEFRRRLRVYRSFHISNTSEVRHLLNGPGDDASPNQGPLGELELKERFRLIEQDNEFAFAVHLVESPAAAVRSGFIKYIRQLYLVLPADTAGNNNIHERRHLPSTSLRQIDDLRARLRTRFNFDPAAAIAPMLASALDHVGRCRAALSALTSWNVMRAQDSAAGSRYELGLGIDLAPPAAAELGAMRSSLLDPARPPDPDPEIEGILQSMTPLTAAQDPEGSWLLRECGMRTVHRVDASRVYVSHLPTAGLAITGTSNVAPGNELPLEARFHAPGDPGKNVVLVTGLNAALTQWQAQGGPPWISLSDAQARNRWDAATPVAAVHPALGVFRAAGLPAVQNPAAIVARLKRLPEELLESVRLAPSQTQAILAGQVTAIDELLKLVGFLRDQGLTSVVPMITGPNEVILVVSVIGLPEAGLNLSDRRATGFRWYVVPLQGDGGQIKSIGSRTVFVPDGPGLSAVVAVGYARRGATDPYEFRVELPAMARMNIVQYEFLMNLLDHAHPLGVEVNTFSIRQQHVDLNGDGNAEPLPPSIFRTFRQFRPSRHHGEAGVGIELS